MDVLQQSLPSMFALVSMIKLLEMVYEVTGKLEGLKHK